MATRRVKTRLTQREVEKLQRDLPGILSGQRKSQHRLHAIYWGAVAHSLFTSIYENFLVKSAGGADDQGMVWDDLAPTTKAYKRRIKRSSIAANTWNRMHDQWTVGLLSRAEQREWSRIFGMIFHKRRRKLGDAEAASLAARVAWTILKKMGAKTMISVFGTRKIPIMIDSGKLVRSLEPGTFDPSFGYRRRNRNQHFRLSPGKIAVGSNLPYADAASQQRPFWDDVLGDWLDQALDDGMEAVLVRIAQL